MYELSTNGLTRVTYAMLPLVLFLSMRPSPLPSTAYLQTLHLHKWISRLVVLAGLVHGVAYFAVFVRKGTVSRIFRILNFLGVVALILMLAMGVTSLKPVRRRMYGVFYAIHYPAAWAIVILGCIHARPGTSILTFWCVLLMAGQIGFRILTSKRVQIEETSISQSLKVLTLPRSALPEYFHIGSHVRLSPPLNSPWAWILPSHPYTIASHPSDDCVKLLAREHRLKISSRSSWTLSGPFPTVNPALFATAKTVLILAGGSGLSFGGAVYRGLRLAGNADVKLIWMIRSKDEIGALHELEIDEATVYITGRQTHVLEGDSDYELDDLLDEDEQDLGGESSSSTLISQTDEEQIMNLPKNIEVQKGRPDLLGEAINFFGETGVTMTPNGSWLIACGPEGLVEETQTFAKKHPDIQFHGEKYVL